MTTWINKGPGQEIGIVQEGRMMEIFPLSSPDWVRTPEELGGKHIRCIDLLELKCVIEDHNHLAKHYILEEGMCCCECLINQEVYWYKRKVCQKKN